MRTQRLPVALVALVLPALAAACGGGGKGSTTATTAGGPAAAVQAAAAKTVGAGSEHVAMTAAVTAAGQSVKLTGSGDFDSKRRLGSLHASFSLGGVQAELDEVLSGSTIYASSPLFSAVLPAGKKWLKLDLTAPGKALGAYTSALASQDPAAALAQLQALTGLREVGTQTIGGVETTHYRGTIDVAKLPAASAALVKSAGATFGPADVWVGSDGYVHRLRVVTSAGAAAQKARTVLTMTLSDFGKKVSASVPPAAETVDASKVSIPGLGG